MGKEIHQLWLRSADRHPRRLAVADCADGQGVRFGELRDRVRALAAGASACAGWRDHVVAFQFGNGAAWFEAFLLCQAVGAIALPLDPDMPEAGVQAVCAAIRPIVLWNAAGWRPLPAPRRRRPACLIKMTSGSSGEPRGLIFEDAQMIADGRQIIATMGLRPDDRHLAVIPLGHSYGLGNLVMPLLLQASGIRVCAAPFPHSVAAAIAAGRVTVLPAVPALCAALARSSVPASALASLRLVISAGSPLDPGDARAFLRRFGRRIHNFYGSTETGGIAYDASGDDTLSGDAVGQPLADVRATIDRTGRLLVVSAAVYRRGNRARHAGLGAFRMPDSVTLREDGALRLHGRRTAFIKVAGKRLNPAEVSRAIHALEGVQAAYVAPYTDGNGRIRLAAAVAAARPLPALRSALRRRLAAWKLPARWLCLDALPLNSRGKVDYARLRRDLTRADTA